jgi:twitching motility two-component system response regulator PilH
MMSIRKIAVVDDEEDITVMYTLMLTRAGYEVRTAENGKDFGALLADWVPDLAILDINMPEMSGTRAIELIIARGQFRALKFLVLGGDIQPEQKDWLDKMGIPHLSKPVNKTTMLEKIEHLKGVVPPYLALSFKKSS